MNILPLFSPKVICIGEAVIDRLGPLGGDPAKDAPVEDCIGGAPANVACGISRLGIPVAFVGRLGQDHFGKDIKDLMLCRKVNIDAIQSDPTRATRIVLVKRDLDGERSFQGFSGDRGAGFSDQGLSLEELHKKWPLISSEAEWILGGTIPLASKESRQTLLWVLEESSKKGLKVAIDINWRPTFWNENSCSDSGPNKEEIHQIISVCERSSLIKLAKEEAIWIFQSSVPGDISRSLPNNPDVVITDGPRPINWLVSGLSGQTNALSPKHVLDTTGAGDSFTAGLVHQFLTNALMPLNSQKIESMIKFAASCGALVCQGAGGIDPQPIYSEVIEFLAASKGGIN